MISSREENWFARHTNSSAIAILLLGFLARLWAASGTFLNPDEALHFRLANQATLAEAYRQSLTTLHPPLFILLLQLWRTFGTSELWLRLPSVIAGTAFCWFFSQWLTQVAGQIVGLLGLLFVALLPPQIMLSAEVRQYALLLAFLMSSLYFLEQALAENSAALIAISTLFLYLAMLTHYSAFLFAAALGVYALSKIFFAPADKPRRASVIATWIGGQFIAVAICWFLYKTHLSRRDFGNSEIVQGWMSYVGRSYFQAVRDNPFLFAITHSFGVFQFLFGQLAVGIVAGLAFLAGVVVVLRRQEIAAGFAPDRRLAILLVCPFALACAASFWHAYPYGGTRHVAFLMIPGVAGVSVALARLAYATSKAADPTDATRSRKTWMRALALAAVLILACIVFGKPRKPWMKRADQSKTHMTAAIDFVEKIEPSDIIFTDYESELVLGHYLCRQKPISFQAAPATFEQFDCGGHRVVSKDFTGWMFQPETFAQDWQKFSQAYSPKTDVWVFQAGWDANLADNLSHQPQFHDLNVERFGENIKIFKTAVTPRAKGDNKF